MKKVLDYYPFPEMGIELLQGFKEHDDQGRHNSHHGIDYILRKESTLVSFPVHSMHAGRASQGRNAKWGRFVVVKIEIDHHTAYESVYAHLEDIDPRIPPLETGESLKILPQFLLGKSGGTGSTNGLIQLHIELHEIDLQTNEQIKLDPYGLLGATEAKSYPQPGESLSGLPHAWSSDLPPYAGQVISAELLSA